MALVRTADDFLWALRMADGGKRWSFNVEGRTLALRGGSRPAFADGRIYAGFSNGELVALESADGSPAWRETIATPSGRTELERLVAPVIERCRTPVEQALRDAGVAAGDVDRIVFVGGPTRMPAVRRFFEELIGRKAEMGVDPMECVAAGAAIQAGVLTGEMGDIVLVDVTPLTLGVETLGGVATALIPRNSPIPMRHTETFTTAADMQTAVTVHVYQGERPMAADNVSLGEFTLEGLAPAPRGVPKVEVTFDIDANGILDVSAKDTASGKSQSIRITGSTRLSEEQKERMVAEAERFAEADRGRREAAEKLNAADAACYRAEKLLADFGDRLTDDMRRRVEQALHDTREALRARDAEAATTKADALDKVVKEAGVTVYAQGQTSGPYAEVKPPPEASEGQEARPSGAGPRGRVVDAQYRESGPR